MTEAKGAGAVSVLGLGAMGTALAHAFLRQGHRVTVWNRTAAKAEPLRASGATVAGGAGAAIEASDLVVVCLADYGVANAVLRANGNPARLHGKVLVQLSTGTPQDARDSAAWANQHGVHYLDGAILAYPKDIGRPDCTVMYAGSADLFEANREVLTSLGGNALFMGEAVGLAATYDTSLLAFYYGAMLAFFQGAAVAESEGVPINMFVATASPMVSLLLATIQESGQMIATGAYDGSQATIDTHTAAVGHLARVSRENGVDRGVPALLEDCLHRLQRAGMGQAELAALFEAVRRHGRART